MAKASQWQVTFCPRSDADGQLAYRGVLCSRDKPNATLQQLLQNVPLLKGETVTDQKAALDLNALLPKTKHFYHYMGAVNHAGLCSEGSVLAEC